MSASPTISLVERVRMLLAEAGYPDAEVKDRGGAPGIVCDERSGSNEVRWRAHGFAGCEPACFACYTTIPASVCRCTGGWPERDCGVSR
jgi:hypothetical protein